MEGQGKMRTYYERGHNENVQREMPVHEIFTAVWPQCPQHTQHTHSTHKIHILYMTAPWAFWKTWHFSSVVNGRHWGRSRLPSARQERRESFNMWLKYRTLTFPLNWTQWMGLHICYVLAKNGRYLCCDARNVHIYVLGCRVSGVFI